MMMGSFRANTRRSVVGRSLPHFCGSVDSEYSTPFNVACARLRMHISQRLARLRQRLRVVERNLIRDKFDAEITP